jgi:hypothetical protein
MAGTNICITAGPEPNVKTGNNQYLADPRVSLFRFRKKMRNKAKRSEKDAKQNSKLARLSETK